MRRVERFDRELKKWIEVKFNALRPNDIFRMFDRGKRYVNSMDGNNIWIAVGEPYKNEQGIYTIDTLY